MATKKARKRNGRTSNVQNHTHSYKLDEKGNGETSRDNQHVHSVRGYIVGQAGKSSHTHSLN